MNTKSMTIRKVICSSLSLILFTFCASGQTVATTDSLKVESGPVEIPVMFFEPDFWILFSVSAILLFAIVALAYSVRKLSKILYAQDESKLAPKAERVTVWHKLMQLLTRSVPVAHEEDVMLDHNYDGIRELDNKLPPWWIYGFYVTIIFAFVYVFYYHIAKTGKLQTAEYNEEMTMAEQQKAERARIAGNTITIENVVRLNDPTSIAAGKETYMKNCVACHGNLGEGSVGPNLTDAYWIHGGGIKNVFQTIVEGVPQKGMIAWKNQLSPKQMEEVASYVLLLNGTSPAGAKEPQGDLYEEVPADSLVNSLSMAKPDTSGGKKM